MRKTFDEEGCEAVLLVDATNAFNALNRGVALHNIKQICPPFHGFLENCYKSPTKLYIAGSDDTKYIYSNEGTTQGDPAAMAMYGLGTKPLMDSLSHTLDDISKQVWYADDSTAAGRLESILDWWKKLCDIGPKYGYFPNPAKTVLILKGKECQPKANILFGPHGIKITTDGERHLGAAIGSKQFKEDYVKAKVDSWILDVKQLASIGEEEPQLAYAAYTKGLCHR